MKQVSGFIVLFLFIFAPFLKIGGFTIHLPYYVAAGLAAIGLWGFLKERALVARTGALVLCSLVLLLGYGVIIGYLNGFFDKEFYLQVLTGMVIVPAGLGIAVLYTLFFHEKSTDYMLWHLFCAGVVHSLIMFVAFASEPVSSFLYSYIPLSEKGQGFVEMRIRSPGLTSAGGDVLSGLHAVLVVIGFYMVLRRWQCLGVLQKTLAVAGFYILIASLSLAARTGYVIVLGLLPVLFIALKWCVQERFSLWFLLKGLTAFLVLGVFAFSTFTSLLDVLGEERAYKRSAEVVESYQQDSGTADISSVTALKEMYFLPTSGLELVLGTGDLGRNQERGYLPSDIGYVRALYGFGLVGALMMYLPFVLIGMMMFRREKVGASQVVIVLCAAAVLAMNLKVFYFWGMRDIFKILAVMLFLQLSPVLWKTQMELSGSWANKR